MLLTVYPQEEPPWPWNRWLYESRVPLMAALPWGPPLATPGYDLRWTFKWCYRKSDRIQWPYGEDVVVEAVILGRRDAKGRMRPCAFRPVVRFDGVSIIFRTTRCKSVRDALRKTEKKTALLDKAADALTRAAYVRPPSVACMYRLDEETGSYQPFATQLRQDVDLLHQKFPHGQYRCLRRYGDEVIKFSTTLSMMGSSGSYGGNPAWDYPPWFPTRALGRFQFGDTVCLNSSYRERFPALYRTENGFIENWLSARHPQIVLVRWLESEEAYYYEVDDLQWPWERDQAVNLASAPPP